MDFPLESYSRGSYFCTVTNDRYYLREHRHEAGLSQPKLAAIAEVDQGTISGIETEPAVERDGKPLRQERVIRKLERALGLPPGGLKSPPHPLQVAEPEKLPPLEEALKGRMTIDVNGVEVELTEEEKAKILAMAKILKGGA
jgi:DNA-binding XRE family transcriptional regulator